MTYYRLTARSRKTQILVVTGGHPYDGPDFFSMLDQVVYDGLGYNWCHVSHPAALAFVEKPELTDPFAMILFYDVPGQDYQLPGAPIQFEPSEAYKAGFERLLERGKPMLFMHHAVVGWPKWFRYSEMLGGCLMTAPGELRGKPVADSGYRYNVSHRIYPVADHPVTRGLEDGFAITDQMYMGEVFEETLTPLMRSDYDFTASGFYSIAAATHGKRDSNEGWDRPPGSNLMVWTRQEKNSPILYMQCGDGRSAYEARGFRQLVRNSVEWLASGAPAAATGS